MNERRVFAPLTKLALLLPKPFEIVVSGKLYRRAERRGTLHINFPFCIASTGAPCNLSQQLKRALSSSKIGHMQSNVGVDYADQSNVRKIEPLSDHLSSDQNIDFTDSKRMKSLSIRVLSAHGICVHSGCGRRWKKLLHRAFDFFGAETSVADRRISALWTFAWGDCDMTAEM